LPLPTKILLEVVTPEGLLLRDEVDEIVAPGELGYFGVRPGHTPFFAALGVGAITYWKGRDEEHLTCFSGFCEVLPDRVNILAQIGERPDEIDVNRAEDAKRRAEERLRHFQDERGYEGAHEAFVRAITRLAVARRERPLPTPLGPPD
jgi:F-type H+-transporting ATPase subunit epsilon